MLKDPSLLYYKLIDVYKKEYNQFFDHKNVKDLSYQVDNAEKEEKEEEGETDQELPP